MRVFENERPVIDYPCRWEYRVIGADAGAMGQAVAEVLGREKYTLTEGKRSPAGRWLSLSLQLEVISDSHRHAVHHALREHPAIRMVL